MQKRKGGKATEATPLLTTEDNHGHSHAPPPAAANSHGHSHAPPPAAVHKHSHGSPVDPMRDSLSSLNTSMRGAECGPGADEHRKEIARTDANSRHKQKTALTLGIGLCLMFMILEIVGGYIAHSLAIMTDAAHLLTDVGALSLSLFAVYITESASTQQYTFGWHRAEIIGALASIFSIWFLTGIILYESLVRMYSFAYCARIGVRAAEADPSCQAVNGILMTIIGVIGLLVNIILALILVWGGAKVTHAHSHGEAGHGHSHAADIEEVEHGHSHGNPGAGHSNVNVQSAFLHALGDCLNSAGVILAAAIIWWGNSSSSGTHTSKSSWYNLADPLASVFFGVITLFTTVQLMKEVLEVLMEGVPAGVDYAKVLNAFSSIPHVEEVHDLHIWSLTRDMLSLSVHLSGKTEYSEQILFAAQQICHDLRPRPITHTTIQIDPHGECCSARCFSDMH